MIAGLDGCKSGWVMVTVTQDDASPMTSSMLTWLHGVHDAKPLGTRSNSGEN